MLKTTTQDLGGNLMSLSVIVISLSEDKREFSSNQNVIMHMQIEKVV